MKQKNHDEHTFIEDITYCPSQIYYYFWEGDTFWCAYIRQRRGPLTFELAEVDPETDGFKFSGDYIELSKDYDINNQETQELEDKEIVEVEKEVMSFLRQRFPGLKFPEQPPRRTIQLGDLI